jgi:hypothetical protein
MTESRSLACIEIVFGATAAAKARDGRARTPNFGVERRSEHRQENTGECELPFALPSSLRHPSFSERFSLGHSGRLSGTECTTKVGASPA